MVEAAPKSGSQIAARLAGTGRKVMAVPGSLSRAARAATS